LLSKLANKKTLRITSLGFFLFLLAYVGTPAYAAQAMASITCQDPQGNTRIFGVGWNNENSYFMDKGNIAAHFCEGGFAGTYTAFVSVLSNDGSELDSSLLYFAGVVPSPTPSPEVSSEPSPATTEEVSRTTERTEDVERSETVERTEEVQSPVEQAPQPAPVQPQPTEEPTPEQTPEPTPEPKPEPKPKPEATPSVEPSVEPTIEPVVPVEPIPTPTEEPEEELPALSLDKLVENLRNIGSDMTPEVREQAQQVVIASIIVSQIAITAIGRKP